MVVTELDSHRHRRPATPDWAECNCGGSTFVLRRRPSDPEGIDHGAVVLRPDGSVLTYVGEPICLDCGSPWTPRGGWPVF